MIMVWYSNLEKKTVFMVCFLYGQTRFGDSTRLPGVAETGEQMHVPAPTPVAMAGYLQVLQLAKETRFSTSVHALE